MKTVKFFAAHVMPNLLFLLEILLGIAAAILSAGIEYSVFNGLLSNAGSGLPVSPVFYVGPLHPLPGGVKDFPAHVH